MITSISILEDRPQNSPLERSLLIVDDEPSVLDLLSELFGEEYRCYTAGSADAAEAILRENDISVVLSDINMQGYTGLELISKIGQISPDTVSIMISGEQNIDAAIGAVQVGAFDYIRKPFHLADVTAAVRRAFKRHEEIVNGRLRDRELRLKLNGQKDQLDFIQKHDIVTELVSYEHFSGEISKAIRRSARDCGHLSVAHLAIDRFDAYCETLGKEAGNEILREVAFRWIDILPETATLARIEHGKFGLLLTNLTCSVEVLETVRDLFQALRQPLEIEGQEIALNLHAGIAIYPQDGSDAASLERSALMAHRRAKGSGANAIKFHEPEMNSSASRRLKLECGVQRALKRGELCNYYQPKVDFLTGRIVGMEALVRWNSAEFGFVQPGEIVPICEEIGLSEALGLDVLERACRDTRTLADRGHELKVSVNVSAAQLGNGWLPEIVTSTIAAAGLDPSMVELEITESSLIENAKTAVSVLERLRSTGFSVAIDDFGTGFSSLSYLNRFPLDTLKIDRTFIKDLKAGSNDTDFVFAIISLAKRLGLRTVVEGIETTEQLELLRGSGCDEWQGFLCSRPMPFDEFRLMVDRYSTTVPATADSGLRLAV
jgi:diguanylate cyclase (GGDEF)-like protein